MTLSADLGPLSSPTLLATLTGGGPYELNGEAIGLISGGEVAVFGPAFIPQQLVLARRRRPKGTQASKPLLEFA